MTRRESVTECVLTAQHYPFAEVARYEEAGVVNFGMVAFGRAELMLNLHGRARSHDASLWFYTDRVDELYRLLRARQLQAVQGELEGRPSPEPPIEFVQELEDMFYGARQFCIRDPDGYELYFIQPLARDERAPAKSRD